MSASSSTNENKAEQVDNCKAQEQRWLDVFLGETFFGSCATHPFRRNELNKYCINCNASTCEYCISSGSHRHHNILKIYRHIHKVVVSLRAMEKHIDCSEIQRYKCNKRAVISLYPLPSYGVAPNVEASCKSCSWKLTEPNLYCYCSISCKVKSVLRNPDDSGPACHHQESRVEIRKGATFERKKQMEEMQKETVNPVSYRKRKRKGTPHRAPFF
ncbi:unnamed protein product [Lupinus luteus]|uniref:B box-type domain-containing protein n=1 Tax=Lupinus luteus TaxID=3873 RepID=A0AAV1X7X4_LUPLU